MMVNAELLILHLFMYLHLNIHISLQVCVFALASVIVFVFLVCRTRGGGRSTACDLIIGSRRPLHHGFLELDASEASNTATQRSHTMSSCLNSGVQFLLIRQSALLNISLLVAAGTCLSHRVFESVFLIPFGFRPILSPSDSARMRASAVACGYVEECLTWSTWQRACHDTGEHRIPSRLFSSVDGASSYLCFCLCVVILRSNVQSVCAQVRFAFGPASAWRIRGSVALFFPSSSPGPHVGSTIEGS